MSLILAGSISLDSTLKFDIKIYIFYFQELVAATPTQRNWKGIVIALVVIAQVSGFLLYLKQLHCNKR
jgi:hypothetical protein